MRPRPLSSTRPPANPTGFAGSVHVKGMLDVFVLSLASRGPISGHNIALTLSQLTNGAWTPSPGTIYPLLHTLKKKGFLVEARGAGRETKNAREVRYAIRPLGRRWLSSQQAMMRERAACLRRLMLPLVGVAAYQLAPDEATELAGQMEAGTMLMLSILTLPQPARTNAFLRLRRSITSLEREFGSHADR